MVTGEYIGALCLSEENAGSDALGIQCYAKKDSDKYILNGSKFWITNSSIADVMIVYARTKPLNPHKRSDGVTAFIVEKKWKGVKNGQKINKMGMKGSPTGEIIFENVEIPGMIIFNNISSIHNPFIIISYHIISFI